MFAIDKSGRASRRRWVRLGNNDFLAGCGLFFSGVFGFARGNYLRRFLDRDFCRAIRRFRGIGFGNLLRRNCYGGTRGLIRAIRTSAAQGEDKKNQYGFQIHV